MIVRFTKLSDNQNKWVDGTGVRDGVLGYLPHEPLIGHQIVLFYSHKQDSAMLYTTPVKTIQYSDNRWTVLTKNSIYIVEKVGE